MCVDRRPSCSSSARIGFGWLLTAAAPAACSICLSAAAAARLKQRFVCLEAHLLAQKTLKTECTDDVC